MKNSIYCTVLVCVFAFQVSFAQNFTKQWQYVESTIEHIDVTELFEVWEYYHQTPLNLNNRTHVNLLSTLNLLTDEELKLIRTFCAQNRVNSIYQLQTLDIELESLRRIRPFITTTLIADETNRKRKTNFYAGLQFQTPQRLGVLEKKYIGTAIKTHLRYRTELNSKWKIGLALEKDIGEPMYYKNKGINNLSWSVEFSGLSKLRKITFGKYDISLGEGILFGTAYRINNPYFLSYNKGVVVKSSLSPKEYNYFEGIASTWEYKQITMDLFASATKANGLNTYDNTGQFRTNTEIEKYKTISRHLVGIHLRKEHRNSNFAWAGIVYKSSLYKEEALFLQSFYLSKNYYNLEFVSETACQDLKAWANIQKLNISLGNSSFLTVQFRTRESNMINEFNSDYTSFSNGYETGFYYAFQSSLTNRWTLKLAFDTFESKQLKLEDVPYEKGRKILGELLKTTEHNKFVCQYQLKQLKEREKTQKVRILYQQIQNTQLRWDTKLYCTLEKAVVNSSLQFNLYWTSKSKLEKLSFSNCYFYTHNESIYWQAPHFFGSYNARFLSGRGSTLSISLQKKMRKDLKIGLQALVLNYVDRAEIGTGNERIANNKKLDFAVYLKWNRRD